MLSPVTPGICVYLWEDFTVFMRCLYAHKLSQVFKLGWRGTKESLIVGGNCIYEAWPDEL